MSDELNRVEDLERNEDRSDESSEASSRLRDFMIPDNTYSGGVDRPGPDTLGVREDYAELRNSPPEGTLRSTLGVTLGLHWPVSMRNIVGIIPKVENLDV